jgi:N-acetylglucosamine kinase-like BadF-type ATPase
MARKKITLIADSGSTKADWRFLQNGKVIHELQTIGFNPNYHPKAEIIEVLEGNFRHDYPISEVTDIYFYGSGCGDDKRKSIIRDALFAVFPIQKIAVHSDMLAAARATCGQEAGITAILGTGSNTILYDGEKPVDSVASLGYILGDEGGGDHLGKALLQAYFYREMPGDLMKKMQVLIPDGRSELLDNLYTKSARPAPYLASFARFYADNLAHSFIQKLATQCFTELVERHILKYKNCRKLPIHFVGSIAYYLQPILKEVLIKNGLTLGRIIRQPIEGLVNFHLK